MRRDTTCAWCGERFVSRTRPTLGIPHPPPLRQAPTRPAQPPQRFLEAQTLSTRWTIKRLTLELHKYHRRPADYLSIFGLWLILKRDFVWYAELSNCKSYRKGRNKYSEKIYLQIRKRFNSTTSRVGLIWVGPIGAIFTGRQDLLVHLDPRSFCREENLPM